MEVVQQVVLAYQRRLHVRLAAKALRVVVILPAMNAFTVVFALMSVIILVAASNSFNALLSPFTHVCILAKSLTCVSVAERYNKTWNHCRIIFTDTTTSLSATPARLPDIDVSTLVNDHISVLMPTARRLSPAARP